MSAERAKKFKIIDVLVNTQLIQNQLKKFAERANEFKIIDVLKEYTINTKSAERIRQEKRKNSNIITPILKQTKTP